MRMQSFVNTGKKTSVLFSAAVKIIASSFEDHIIMSVFSSIFSLNFLVYSTLTENLSQFLKCKLSLHILGLSHWEEK